MTLAQKTAEYLRLLFLLEGGDMEGWTATDKVCMNCHHRRLGCKWRLDGPITLRSRETLSHFASEIENRLVFRDIVDGIAEVLSEMDMGAIVAIAEADNAGRVKALLSLMASRSQKLFGEVLDKLWDGGYGDLAAGRDDVLLLPLSDQRMRYAEDFVKQRLAEGGVPAFGGMVQREEVLTKVRFALRGLSLLHGSTCMLVLHGMGGSGKTVLAAQSLQSVELLAEGFEHGVIWKSVGHLRDLSGPNLTDEISRLLAEIVSHPMLGLDIDEKELSQLPLDVLRTLLSRVVAGRRLLLLLDDVWNAEVLTAFQAIPIVLLVTTRKRDFTSLHKSKTLYLQNKLWNHAEAKEILSARCSTLSEKTLDVALSKCNGLPLALSVVAAVFKGRTEKRSRELLGTVASDMFPPKPFKGAPVEYESLADVVAIAIADLDRGRWHGVGKRLLDLYLDFGVTRVDEDISAAKMKDVWMLDVSEVSDILKRLARHVLLFAVAGPRSSDGRSVFRVHDVLQDFLKEMIKARADDGLSRRHMKWIESYLRRTNSEDLVQCLERAVQDEELHHIVDDLLYHLERTEAPPGVGKMLGTDMPRLLLLVEGIKARTTRLAYLRYIDQLCSGHAASLAGEEQERLSEYHYLTKKLLESTQRGDHWTLVHLATWSGRQDALRALLSHGGRVNAIGFFLRTPLHAAAMQGCVEVVQLLLDNGAEVNAADSDGTTPLFLASERAHTPVVTLLVDRGARVRVGRPKPPGAQVALKWEGVTSLTKQRYLELQEKQRNEPSDDDFDDDNDHNDSVLQMPHSTLLLSQVMFSEDVIPREWQWQGVSHQRVREKKPAPRNQSRVKSELQSSSSSKAGRRWSEQHRAGSSKSQTFLPVHSGVALSETPHFWIRKGQTGQQQRATGKQRDGRALAASVSSGCR